MPDQQQVEGVRSSADELKAQIGSSLSAVWARYAGARPTDPETQVDGDVVRWILPEGTSQFEAGMAAEPEPGERPGPVRTPTGYRREAAAAVSRATHAKVLAIISRHDTKTGIVRDAFVLEARRRRN